ncbi:hypothetical protein GJA_2220 [Janthinobacterium agaricidamnosum NBRC 102515 = DSM 9628]|uniref:Uncharacterized protein n=1 Tax=Janthinobacterium agaricidamnosum NBRC 102515 = DSM 9628 TaxID=1349767 RepID=W0V5G9_9BURK|nr:hypothetical protein GJA_2220 [Janthinobacterium agaricidamnosum NBRC 102515 = DSM 9628]
MPFLAKIVTRHFSVLFHDPGQYRYKGMMQEATESAAHDISWY